MSIASEITDLQTNLQAAKSAVTTKGGTVGDTGLAGLATEIASIPSGGGGDVVNAVIKQFKAATTDISADNFIAFANNLSSGEPTTVASSYAAYSMSVAKIDNSTIYCAYQTSGSSITLSVYSISDSTFTLVTSQTITGSSNDDNNVGLVNLGSGKVMLFHRSGSGLAAQVAVYENSAITLGTAYTRSTSGSYDYVATLVDSSTVAYCYSNSGQRLYAGILTVNADNTITTHTVQQVNETQTSGVTNGRGIALLDTTHLLVTYRAEGNTTLLKGTIITINNDLTLSIDNRYDLATATAISEITKIATLSNSTVLLGVEDRDAATLFNHLTLFKCVFNGTTVTTTKVFNKFYHIFSYDFYSDSEYLRIFISFGETTYNTDAITSVLTFYIGNGSLSFLKEERLTDACYVNVYQPNNTAINLTGDSYAFGLKDIISNSSYNVTLRVVNLPEPTIELATTTVAGLTKTTATSSTAGDVYVLGSGE